MILSNTTYKHFFILKRLQISSTNKRKDIIIIKQIFKAKLENYYYFKLCYS